MKTTCKTIALQPHRPQIAWTSGPTVHFFNIRTGSETLTFTAKVYVLRIQFSADGHLLVVSGTDHESVYDANTGQLQFTMSPDHGKPPPPIICRKILDIDAEGLVWALAEQTTLPRKPILARYSPRTKTWETLIDDLGGLPLVAPTILSTDHRLLAIPIIEPSNTMPRIGIDVWEIATAQKLKHFTGHWSGLHALSFSPDGQWLASMGFPTGLVKMWPLTDPQPAAIAAPP